jgi:hypothetical protein
MDVIDKGGGAGAANPKFAHTMPQVRLRTSGSGHRVHASIDARSPGWKLHD